MAAGASGKELEWDSKSAKKRVAVSSFKGSVKGAFWMSLFVLHYTEANSKLRRHFIFRLVSSTSEIFALIHNLSCLTSKEKFQKLIFTKIKV